MRFWWLFAVAMLCNVVPPVLGQAIPIDEMQIFQSPDAAVCRSKHTDTRRWPLISLHHLPQQQHFCLSKTIEIDREQLSDVTAVIISILGSSRLYWDGHLIGENGRVGKNRQSENPGRIYFVAPIPADLSRPGLHQLTIEISNFHINEKMASIFYFLAVGDYASAVSTPLLQSGLAIFFMGGLLVIGLLFQFLYWLYQRRILYQVFSLLCFSYALLLLAEKWRSLFGYSYDWHPTRMHWIMIFTFASCLTLPAFYLVYYQIKKLRLWLAVMALVLVPTLLVQGYDGKSAALFLVSLTATLAINLSALLRKMPGAGLNTLIIAMVSAVFIFSPYAFLEDRFAITSFAVVLVVLASLVREMKMNRTQALAAIRYEVELLKRNLQPHFLMNSLMLAIEWIEQKPYAAATFVQALADELRMLVKFSGERTVSLEEEIALCRRHLEIMGCRYNTTYQLIINGVVEGISVPPAVLHTQIENAFSHNRIPADSAFGLTIEREKGKVVLILSSPFNKKLKSEGAGVGERYIRTRLAEVFGHDSRYEGRAESNLWLSTIEFRIN